MTRSKLTKGSLMIGIIWLLNAGSTCYGQIDKYLDKVILKNGSVIWGITETSEDQLLVHLTSEEVIAIPLSEVSNLLTQRLNPRYFQNDHQGSYYQVSWGVTLGKSHSDFSTETNFNVSVVSGHRFNSYLAAGLGAGLYYYPQFQHFPLFLEVQGDVVKSRFTPVYYLRSGWSLASARGDFSDQVDKSSGGFYFEPGAGFKLYGAGHAVFLKVSYLRQNSKTTFNPIDFGNGQRVLNVETRTFERTTLTLGVIF